MKVWSILLGGFLLLATGSASAATLPASYTEVSSPLAGTEHYTVAEVIRTKQAVLDSLHLNLDPLDKVFFQPDPELGLGTTVTVQRAPKLDIHDGKKHLIVRSWQPTIEAALTEANLSLADLDTVSPGRDTLITSDVAVTITRVSETDLTIKTPIPFETVTTDDSTLEKGTQTVTTEGKNGERTQIFHIRREDGEEISRKLTSDRVTTAPVTKRVRRGTKLPFIASGVATWYSGVPAKTAASKTIPRGTEVLVTNLISGKSVQVKINDYGPFGAEIDLSEDAFQAIGDLGAGRLNVKIEKWIPD